VKRRHVLVCAVALCGAANAQPCEPGTYGVLGEDFVALAPVDSIPAPGLRYLFRNGRRGSTLDADAPLRCRAGQAEVQMPSGRWTQWPRIALRQSDSTFSSAGSELVGRLIEPGLDTPRPLVVMVHGSERTSALNSVYAYALAAQGLRVFVYDKRGTGGSQGEYTQNFELLAEDAANALVHARGLAAGRFDRAGYFGGSQGGWVAPLAATRSPADFVAIGFGLVVSPIEEDREQMRAEARAANLGPEVLAGIDALSMATATLLTSNFETGYEALEQMRRDPSTRRWAEKIHGEHSGAMLRMSDADLRRIGRARFDNLELIWNYDALAVLRRLDTPLLWVLAEEDREAPIERTRELLRSLVASGKPVEVYVFPGTDHGMVEFVTAPDGTRQVTRITDGYLKLLGDWIRGIDASPYGRGQRLDRSPTPSPDASQRQGMHSTTRRAIPNHWQ
jgi:pimeloyl-ACP methyl ester carboxylesterase